MATPNDQGFGLLADSFAADVDADLAAFMADSQVPWGVEALGGTISEAAWREQANRVPPDNRGSDDPAHAQRWM